MNFIMQLFGWPMGWIMFACYFLIPDYGIALILFTILTKLLLLPLSIKQQKEQAKMAFFKPKLDAIQKKYANNKEKYNEEIQKLYTEEHYNPLSGCLPTLIQFPLLFGLIDVIYRPMTHLLRFGTETIDALKVLAQGLGVDLTYSYTEQITILNSVHSNPTAYSSLGTEVVDKILNLNMTFLGLDFTQTPQFKLMLDGAFNILLLIPLLSGISALAMSLITMKTSAATTGEQNASANAMSRSMMLVMPIFSVYIAFVVPAGVGFYWLVSNLFAIAQSLYLNWKYNPKEIAEKMIAEAEASKEDQRRQRQEAKKRLAEGTATEDDKKAAMSQKEKDRRKLAEARRRDAEKYGEEYVEVTDDDLK